MEKSNPKAAPQPHILLVDDDPAAIQLMGGILTSVAGLRFAANGKDALRLAAARAAVRQRLPSGDRTSGFARGAEAQQDCR
jgi:CheY-like chemotaxis protein